MSSATTPRDRLHPYVSELAARVVRSGVDRGTVSVDGSLAFFDISGFTPLTERLARLGRGGAEYINDVLNTVFTGLIDVVFRFGGDVLEFGGDAMVVLYTGDRHESRAAAAAAEMNRFMRREGRIATPAGKVQLGMSCGMASGSQPYYLLGSTRRALVVAGPVSTAMALLESAASAGQVLIDDRLASALPASWVGDPAPGGGRVLELGRVRGGDADRAGSALDRSDTRIDTGTDTDTDILLPVQFRDIADAGRRSGELKQVAMAFLRLVGTDDLLAEGGVAAVDRRLEEITNIVDQAAGELGVCWLETQAEANSVRWTLISGAPTATEHDGERLLRVLRRIADAVPGVLRIGANLGVVFVGDMGHPERCTYIVMGDTTNLAARLMAKAGSGQIVAGERLVATCPGQFHTTRLEPFMVKGKGAPITAFVVGDLQDGSDETAGSASTEEFDQPLVGRDEELRALTAAIDAAAVVEIVGEPGVGKSRLWQEAHQSDPSRVWRVAAAEPHETGTPYLPIRRLVRQALGIGRGSDRGAVGVALGALVTGAAPELRGWLPLLADVAGAEVDPTDEVDALDPAFRADRTGDVAAYLLVAMAATQSVIVVEDVHWLDESSRRVLEVLARIEHPKLAVVLTRRTVGWQPPATVTIELAPIAAAAAEQLLLTVLPASLASDATLERLRATASGNPLYLLEMARVVAAGQQDAHQAFPETVERVIAARIDQLPTADRAVIREASTLGARFDRRLAARVLERPDLERRSAWEEHFGDLVVIAGDDVSFQHDLIRVAAYEGLSMRRRKQVHRRAGAVIEEWGEAAPVSDRVAALAFHAAGAGVPERIVNWCQQAADAAIAKGATELAERFLKDVIDAQRATGAARSQRCATHRQLAEAAERGGHPEVALAALARAARLAEAPERSEIAVERTRVLWRAGQFRAGLVTTARALRTCDDAKTRDALMLARATVLNFKGRWRQCLAVLAELLEHSDLELGVRAQAHFLAEWCCGSLGLPERAAHSAEAERLLIELDDSIGLGNLYLNRGESAWRECRVEDAVLDFTWSADRYRHAGHVLGAALADNNLAELLTLQFRLDEAEVLLNRARRVTTAAGYPIGTCITISGLSRIAAWSGRVDQALDLQTEALDGFRRLGAEDLVVDSLVRLVEIHLLAGDPGGAYEVAEQADRALLDLAEIPVLPATLARLRAQTFVIDRRPEEARAEFERACSLARSDGFTYEVALSELALGRLDRDDRAIEAALAQLGGLGVLAPPPGLVDQLAT